MSINGSISVNALFHDTDGTTSLKIVSLKSSDEYTTGKVAVVSGTAGTSAVTLDSPVLSPTYRDASGGLVSFSTVRRILFSWSGQNPRTLTDAEYDTFKFTSSSGSVAASLIAQDNVVPSLSAGTGTGTYTIVIYGT